MRVPLARVPAEARHGDGDWPQPFLPCRSARSIATSHSPTCACSALSALALCSVFYISTFTELTEKVLKGAATWTMLWTFLLYQTPQYLYYIIPLSVLLATLVTVALLTKNSELIVMKACGISLYRVALPMVGAARARWRHDLRARADRARTRQPESRGDQVGDARRIAGDIRRAQSPLGDGQRRRHLSLQLLRSARSGSSPACGSTSSTPT